MGTEWPLSYKSLYYLKKVLLEKMFCRNWFGQSRGLQPPSLPGLYTYAMACDMSNMADYTHKCHITACVNINTEEPSKFTLLTPSTM